MPNLTRLVGWGRAATLCLLTSALFSCVTSPNDDGNETLLHFGVPNLRLSLTLSSQSGSPGSPVHARAIIENLGVTPVKFWGGCACWQPYFELLDVEGQVVRLQDACAVLPMCPCWIEELGFKEKMEMTLSVDGTTWGKQCGEELQLSPGRYTVAAFFQYEDGGHSQEIEKTAEFEWTN